jgi:HlyD family secretion protein
MRLSKFLKYLIIIVIALLLIFIFGKIAGWFGGNKAIVVSVEKAQKRTIYEVVTANGKIQPEKEIKVSADVSGEIVELYIKEGESIKQGQILLKIKPDIYVSGKDRAVAAVNTIKANYGNALARLDQIEAQFTQSSLAYERNKKLWEQSAISKADWDASIAAYEIARANVEASKQDVKSAEYNVKSAEASLKEANERLIKTSVFSPIDGIITRLIIEKGERVAGTDMMAGTEMLRVADLRKMEVKVDVNENDIVRVHIGDTAIIEVDAYLDQKFKGIVTEIANSANTSGQISADQVTSFEVKIMLLENSYKHLITSDKPFPFRPGMTATVDIQTQKKDSVLSVPIEAVTARSDSELKIKATVQSTIQKVKSSERVISKLSEIVFVKEKSFAREKKVKTGIQDNNYIEIIDGINDNEEIIIAPFSAISKKLKDSTLIKVVNKKDLFNEK